MRNYYSDEDYVQAEYVLYNDLDEDLLPGLPQVDLTVDEDVVKKLLKKGEKWVDLSSHHRNGYIMTNYGRVINTIKVKQLRVTITTQSIHVYVQSRKLAVKDIFDSIGWRYNMKEIMANYNKYGWRYTSLVNKSK